MLLPSLVAIAVVLAFFLLARALRARSAASGPYRRPMDAAALAALKVAWQKSPDDVPLIAKLAQACLEQNDLEGAQKHFRGLLLQPLDACPLSKAEIFYYLAETSRRKGERAPALRLLQRALEADPTLPAALQLQRAMAPREP